MKVPIVTFANPMFHSGSGAPFERFTRQNSAAVWASFAPAQRAGVIVTTPADKRVTMVPPTCACSTAEQEDQTTHAPCTTLVSLRRPLQGNSGDASYDRPAAAQPLAAPPHTSDTELGSSTSPAALVNTGERHSGDAPPQPDIHDIPPGWSGDHPDRELETYSDFLEWLEQLERPTPGSRTLGFSAENEEDGYTCPHAATESVSLL